MKRIYLDNSATTRVADEVVEAMLPYMTTDYGNASSLHSFGQEAKEALEQSRAAIAEKVSSKEREVVFTSGGTESNNLAIRGAVLGSGKKSCHIITTKIEHASILKTVRQLESEGHKATYLDVDRYGVLDPADVSKAVKKDTVLITIGHANSEIGTLQDIATIGKAAHEAGVYFHTDACQSFMKSPIHMDRMNLDLLTINAHKINGPKGVGALIVRDGTKLKPLLYGGEHEHRLRAGTENVAGIVGFAKAAEITTDKEVAQMTRLRDKLIAGVLDGIKDTRLNGHPTQRICNNVNITYFGIEGESLLLRLDAKGIACSTGSACSSTSLEPSHVIMALGCRPEEAHGSLRMSLGRYNTDDEVPYIIEALKEEVGNLRRMSPVGR